jgi:ppGpp synthetase/RelA/SpoT-type nucleotidyltranferase
VVDKTFRLNVLWNRRWPEKPDRSDWVTDLTLYSIIDDLVRTKIVCTYLDGPGLVSDALKAAAIQMDMPAEIRKLSREEGYYAHHLYINFPISIATRNGVKSDQMPVELQVTTQPQELLRHLTHIYYREQRMKAHRERDDWQWQFRTNRFKARYLSHALHLLEAMILDVRDNPDTEDAQEHE